MAICIRLWVLLAVVGDIVVDRLVVAVVAAADMLVVGIEPVAPTVAAPKLFCTKKKGTRDERWTGEQPFERYHQVVSEIRTLPISIPVKVPFFVLELSGKRPQDLSLVSIEVLSSRSRQIFKVVHSTNTFRVFGHF